MSLRDLIEKRNASGTSIVCNAGHAEAPAADKKSNALSRRCEERDRRTLAFLRSLEGSGTVIQRWKGPLSIYGGEGFPLDGMDDDLTDLLYQRRRKLNEPPPWRDVAGRFKLLYINRALIRAHGAVPFTARLAYDVFIPMARKRKPAVWLNERLKRFLEPALGFVPDLFFVIEEYNRERRWRPHIHGTLGINSNHVPAVTDALKRFVGTHHPRHLNRKEGGPVQVGEKWYDDPDGWVWYVTKDLSRPGNLNGNKVCRTQEAKRLGQQLYETERRRLLDCLARSAGKSNIGAAGTP